MSKIAILYCIRVQDHSCIVYVKSYKGISEKNGEFAKYDKIELVAMTDYGNYPSLVVTLHLIISSREEYLCMN
jgi:predicted metal-binding protein